MKNIISLLFVLSCSISFAQKVEFKKGKVLVDKVECMTYSSTSNTVELTTLDNKNNIILKFIRTGVGQNDGLYTKIVFVEQNKSFTTRSYIFSKGILVSKMLKEKILKECTIDESAIDKFIVKYDEQIEETLIRH